MRRTGRNEQRQDQGTRLHLDVQKIKQTAMTVGSWYFAQSDRVGGMDALKTTFTSSSPVVSVASIISSIVDFVVSRATSRFWWTDPLGCIMRCLSACLQSCFMAMKKYAMIGHAFTGNGFVASGKAA
jgi:hypothetical protein